MRGLQTAKPDGLLSSQTKCTRSRRWRGSVRRAAAVLRDDLLSSQMN